MNHQHSAARAHVHIVGFVQDQFSKSEQELLQQHNQLTQVGFYTVLLWCDHRGLISFAAYMRTYFFTPLRLQSANKLRQELQSVKDEHTQVGIHLAD